MFALLESVWNLLQYPYDIYAHLTLGMLLHYLEKLNVIRVAIRPPVVEWQGRH